MLTAAAFSWFDVEETDKPARRPNPAGPPLMGDIATVRCGVPEHLIQWRRAEGEDDPDPQLPAYDR